MKGTLTDRVVLPRSPMAALPEEVETVVDYAKAQPGEECRRLAGMMVDEDIAHLTLSTVYRNFGPNTSHSTSRITEESYDGCYRLERLSPEGENKHTFQSTITP